MDNTIPDAYSRLHTMNLLRYKKMKIHMLKEDFGIPLTKEDIDKINNCASEIAIDRYARELMNKRWNH